MGASSPILGVNMNQKMKPPDPVITIRTAQAGATNSPRSLWIKLSSWKPWNNAGGVLAQGKKEMEKQASWWFQPI